MSDEDENLTFGLTTAGKMVFQLLKERDQLRLQNADLKLTVAQLRRQLNGSFAGFVGFKNSVNKLLEEYQHEIANPSYPEVAAVRGPAHGILRADGGNCREGARSKARKKRAK